MQFALAARCLRAGPSPSALPERRRRPRAAEALDRHARLGLHGVVGRAVRGTTTCRSSRTSCSVGAVAAAGRGSDSLFPAVEFLTALLITGCFFAFGLSGQAFVAALLRGALPYRPPTSRTGSSPCCRPAGCGIVLVAQTVLEPSPEWALAAFGAGFFLLVAAMAYPGGMGIGDVKLAVLLGAMLGRTVPVALMIGMVAALFPRSTCSRSTVWRRARWASRLGRSSRSAA